jgi:hypothetical protein
MTATTPATTRSTTARAGAGAGADGLLMRAVRWGSRAPVPLRGAWRTTLFVAVLGQAFAALLLVGVWSTYENPRAVGAVWVAVGLVLPALVLSAARRHGRPATGVVLAGVLVLVAADVLVPALSPPGGRLAAHGWNWGAVALVLLGASAYVPLGTLVAGMLGHAAAAVAWGAVSAGDAVMPWLGVVNTIASCLLAPVAAVAFLHDYRGVLERREAAARRRRAVQARAGAEAVAAEDAARRLASIRQDVVPLLDSVIEGAPIPLGTMHRALAGELAESLRSTLTRSETHPALVLPPGLPDRLPLSVSIGRGSDEALDRLTRGAVTELVTRLLDRPGWVRAGISLRPATDAPGVLFTVVAVGAAAQDAATDLTLLAALARLRPGLVPMTETDPPALTVQTVLPPARSGAGPR